VFEQNSHRLLTVGSAGVVKRRQVLGVFAVDPSASIAEKLNNSDVVFFDFEFFVVGCLIRLVVFVSVSCIAGIGSGAPVEFSGVLTAVGSGV